MAENKLEFPITKQFTFTKADWPAIDKGEIMFEFLKENYSVEIPQTVASKLKITVELLSKIDFVTIWAFAEGVKRIDDIIERAAGHCTFLIPTSPNQQITKYAIQLASPGKDVTCEGILFNCDPLKDGVKIKITCSL